jgi:N-formylglutamate deformylase
MRVSVPNSSSAPMPLYELSPGGRPLLMSIPHTGTYIPPALASSMAHDAIEVPDTDWHLDRLYDFAAELDITVLKANYSRYVIDLNRPPDNRPLYPGANNTELVPTTTFAWRPIYSEGAVPDATEISRRRSTFWRPYHETIERTLADMQRRHHRVVLFDCHSIRSRVPRFFEGKLADLNLGTASGTSCHPDLRDRLEHVLRRARGFSLAVDGRFKGGYITRQYGRPAENIHCFQLELSEATYMEETPPFDYRADRADGIRPTLRAMLETALRWAEAT